MGPSENETVACVVLTKVAVFSSPCGKSDTADAPSHLLLDAFTLRAVLSAAAKFSPVIVKVRSIDGLIEVPGLKLTAARLKILRPLRAETS